MSSEWREVSIDDIKAPRQGSIAIGPFGSRMKSDCYVSEGVRVVRGTNLTGGRSFSGEFVFITPEKAAELNSAIDLLAAGGAFGFERPKICVQVKSGDTPADRPEFTQLIGAMQSVGADQGLFVSWSGIKSTVAREVPTQFFKVRVWNSNDLIEQLLNNYDKLDEDIKAELPLKRIWTIATPED